MIDKNNKINNKRLEKLSQVIRENSKSIKQLTDKIRGLEESLKSHSQV